MIPVVGPIDRPVGKLPTVIAQVVYGAMPPVAASGCEYAAPWSTAGNDVVVMLRAAFTVIVDCALVPT
jgi:hypothetical protein